MSKHTRLLKLQLLSFFPRPHSIFYISLVHLTLQDKFKKLSPCFYILLPSSPPQRHLLNERRPKSSLTLLSLFLNFPKRKQTVQGRGRTDDVEVANFFGLLDSLDMNGMDGKRRKQGI